MRLIYTLVIVLMMSSVSFSWGNPGNSIPDKESLILVDTEDITLSILEESQRKYFRFAEYNLSDKTLNIKTRNVIHYIQVFNLNNQLEFQLFVGSDHVRINKSLLEHGDYKLAFIIQNEDHLQFISLNVNS